MREIAEEKISIKELEDSAINKLRKHVEETVDTLDLEETEGDNFENIYKGEISKSGIPILPSKRARKIPEKIETTDQKEKIQEKENSPQDEEVSLEEVREQEKIDEESDKLDSSETSET